MTEYQFNTIVVSILLIFLGGTLWMVLDKYALPRRLGKIIAALGFIFLVIAITDYIDH